MHRTRLLLWLGALVALALGPRAMATSVLAPDFDSLVAQADYIVRAKVKSVTSEWRANPDKLGDRYIGTLVELEVLETIAGTPPSPLVLDLVGGKIGDQELTVQGTPNFQVGQESILFVKGNGRLVTPLVAMMHGYYPVRRDTRTATDQVLRFSGKPLYSETDVILPLGATSGTLLTNPAARPLTAAAFATKIRQSYAHREETLRREKQY